MKKTDQYTVSSKSKPCATDNLSFIDLLTPEGQALPAVPHNYYPRPQLERDSFFCLNGSWEFETSLNSEIPQEFSKKIIVPFAPQSILSSLHIDVPDSEYLFYRRSFTLPDGFMGDRLLLHFGAVDQVADVWINGRHIGSHTGGYDSFCFDITSSVEQTNTIIVRAKDDLNQFILPYGKQRTDRGGMWYTPVSGIWQTVWLESVPREYVKKLDIDTRADGVLIKAEGVEQAFLTVHTPDGDIISQLKDGKADITLPNPRMWSPEDPYLYYFDIDTGCDRVRSYFALRQLSTQAINGIPRLCLNGKPYFFHGLLDQGYWSDGIFTPADESFYEKDIMTMKSLGFNMLRKHIKIEPDRFYYDCDRLGMVVFQDMVNNCRYSFFCDTALPTIAFKYMPDKLFNRNKQMRAAFENSMKTTVSQLKNHPCICCWTIFNEGWGQHDSESAYYMLKQLDSSRFIDSASGWFKPKVSDFVSEHVYFKAFKPKIGKKPLVLSEFGGYCLKIDGHIFNPNKAYGYRTIRSREDFSDALIKLYNEEIIPAVKQGLCCSIYTQVSDVEDEINGLFTYDRQVLKITPKKMLPIARAIEEEMQKL